MFFVNLFLGCVSAVSLHSEDVKQGSSGIAATTDYDKQYNDAAKIVQQWVFYNDGQPHNDADAFYTHPETNAKVYCGNIEAAKDQKFHAKQKVFHIVNCMCSSDGDSESSMNFYANQSRYTYFNFPIARLAASDSRGTEYLPEPFTFIDNALESGKSVLIHCAAGAHRAGSTATAYLMYKNNLSYPEALKVAKEARGVIDPGLIFDCDAMLKRYDQERSQKK